MRIKQYVSALLIGLTTVGLVGCSGGADNKTINVGAILSLTGVLAHGGVDARNALQLAVEEVNANGGIKGRQVKLLVENTNTDPERTVSGALKLANENKVLAIVGPDNSPTAFAARSQVAEPEHIVIMSVTGSSPKLTEGNPRWFFRGATPAEFQTKSLVQYLVKEKGLKRFAILSDSGITDQIESFTKDLKVMGLEPVATEMFKSGQTNFNGPLLNIKSKNPEAIFFIGYITEGASALTQARNLGVDARFLGSIGIIYDEFIKVAGKSSEGVIASIGFTASNEEADVQKFVTAYKAKYNQDPSHAAAQAYDQINLIFQAIQNQNLTFDSAKVEQDRVMIRDYLEQVKNYKGITSMISYSPIDHSAYKDVNILEVVNGKWKVIKHSGEAN